MRNGNPIKRGLARIEGFTLIEMMVVITIMLILIGMAAGMYSKHVARAREAALKSDLKVMRDAIENYTVDKEAAPQSLDELVAAHYLRQVPTDPITGQKDWRVDYGDGSVVLSPDQTSTGIVDVHSNSDRTSPFEGTPYSTW